MIFRVDRNGQNLINKFRGSVSIFFTVSDNISARLSIVGIHLFEFVDQLLSWKGYALLHFIGLKDRSNKLSAKKSPPTAKIRNRLIAGAAACALAGVSTSAQAGYGHWLELKISNPDTTAPLRFQIRDASCVNTNGDGNQMRNSDRVTPGRVYTAPAGGSVILGFNHDPASSCDGDPADFSITVGSDAKNVVYFRAYENGEVTLNTSDYRGPTPATGMSFERSGRGNSSGGQWTWTAMLPPDKLAKGKGHWVNRCNYICSEFGISTGISTSDSTTKESSQERASMMSATATVGIEYGGVSAEVSTTTSDERRVGSSIAREISSGTESVVTQTYPKPEGWKNVWQWIVVMKKERSGEALTFQSNEMTCTMDNVEPGYMPGTAASRAGDCDTPPPGYVAAVAPVAAPVGAVARPTPPPAVSASANRYRIAFDDRSAGSYFVNVEDKIVEVTAQGQTVVVGKLVASTDMAKYLVMLAFDELPDTLLGVDSAGVMWMWDKAVNAPKRIGTVSAVTN